MLVEPGLDPPAGLRAATPSWPSSAARAAHWTREGKAVAAGQADGRSCGEVIPLHRELQERGQVELTTTPFYHPILPLLWDKRLARRAMPDVRPAQAPGRLSRRRRGAHPPRGGLSREDFRPQAARHVALGRLGVPGDGAGHRRRRHPVDRHRRGDSLLLDRRLGLPRRQRLSSAIRKCSIAPGAWKTRARACRSIFRDHAMSDQIGFHYQRYRGRARGGRFHRQDRGHRQRHRRQRRPPAHAGEHHPRRRKLLGILSQRRRGFPPAALPAG